MIIVLSRVINSAERNDAPRGEKEEKGGRGGGEGGGGRGEEEEGMSG